MTIKFKDQILVENTDKYFCYFILSSTDVLPAIYNHPSGVIDIAEYSSTLPEIIISVNDRDNIDIYLKDSILNDFPRPLGEKIKILWESEEHLVKRILARILT